MIENHPELSAPSLHGPSAAHEQLMAIIGSATDAIITVNADHLITLFNAAAERIFLCPAAEAIGSPLTRFIPERFHSAHDHHIDRFAETGVTVRAMGPQRALTALRTDGVEFPVEVTISQITVAGQKLFTAIIRDISDRHAAEEIRAKLAAIVESSDDAIIGKTLDGIISTWNSGAQRLFGYTAHEVIGRPILILIPPDRHEEEALIQTRLRKGERIEHLETVRLRHDGTPVHVSLTISPIRDSSGKIVGVSKFARDITDRIRAADALARHSEELARSNVELERFAYIASHDLQEPMRTVHSFAQLLQRRYGEKLTGDAEEYLRFITDGVLRMQTLINDLLAYSRVNSQGAVFATADCNQIAAHVLENLQASLTSHNARVTVGPLPTLLCDATQLGQLFQNLLINAIKFHGQAPPEIHLSAEFKNGEWIFSVRDNGIGIDPEYFDRIFIIFQRLHTIEEYPGTGIGLAICKKIVERHGGRIWLQSALGQGTTFFFSIPKKEKPQ